jgi:hypothetical protein
MTVESAITRIRRLHDESDRYFVQHIFPEELEQYAPGIAAPRAEELIRILNAEIEAAREKIAILETLLEPTCADAQPKLRLLKGNNDGH